MPRCVTARSYSLLAYLLGCVLLAGCGAASDRGGVTGGGATSGGSTPLASGGASLVYAVQTPATVNGQGSVLTFPANVSGSVTPSATLSLPAGFYPVSIMTDAYGQMYVGGDLAVGNTGEVLVYAAGATGTAAPLRTITGGLSTLWSPNAMALDAAGQLYVAFGNIPGGISVFAANANGAAAPLRVITGPATLLDLGPDGLAVDASGTIYAIRQDPSGFLGGVLAFSSTATGNAAPIRNISGSNTPFGEPEALTLDNAGNLNVVSLAAGAPLVSTLSVYASTATGNVAPLRSITGANTGLATVRDIHVDAAGNIYVAGLSSSLTPFVAAFAPTQTGNTAPAISFTSVAWQPATGTYQIALR